MIPTMMMTMLMNQDPTFAETGSCPVSRHYFVEQLEEFIEGDVIRLGGPSPHGSYFLHDMDGKKVIANWHERSITDSSGTIWFGINEGYAPDGIDHVIFHVTGRGSVRINRPRNLVHGVGTYWIGFTGSISRAASMNAENGPNHGLKVPDLVEVQEGETLELRVVMVSRNGNVAISPEPIRIGITLSDDPELPWPWQYKIGGEVQE